MKSVLSASRPSRFESFACIYRNSARLIHSISVLMLLIGIHLCSPAAAQSAVSVSSGAFTATLPAQSITPFVQ